MRRSLPSLLLLNLAPLAITVSDACGQVVMRSQGKAELEQWMHVSGLSAGAYAVLVSVDDRGRMLRFVKE